MKKLHEEKLLRAIAKKHIGDIEFCKKYGMNCPTAEEMLEPYYENGKDEIPPAELLEKADVVFIQEFTSELSKLLEKDSLPESIYQDLVFGGTSD